MKTLLAEIERVLPDGGSWCELPKAATLAALIVALHPKVVVEIGIWQGGSMVPMLLALKHVGGGRAVAIDPWSAAVSIVNETEENRSWWGQVDHEAAYRKFVSRLEVLDLTTLCEIWRKPSDDCTPPDVIDMLHIDGSHTQQAVRDVERYASKIPIGGILVMDDCKWDGGGVLRALTIASSLGFVTLYPCGTGCIMQRRAAP